MALSWGLGIALGIVAIGLKKGGFLTTTDVGGLTELAGIQAQLHPLDACRIQYATRDKRGNRTHLDAVFVEACSHGSHDTTVVRVPSTWGQRAVGFEMTRSSPSARWKILVEKNEIPFPDLLGALEDLSPRIVAGYPDELARVRTQMDAYYREQAEREAAAEARKRSAPSTYPSK